MKKIVDNIEVRIDKRTELLSIIEIISNYRNKYPFLLEKYGNKSIIEETQNKFNCFKNHRVIKLFNEIIEKYDFSFSSPIILFLQLNEDFTVNKNLNEPFSTRLNSDPIILELMNEIKNFVEMIKFDKYYLNNQSRYEKFVNIVVSQVENKNIYEFIKNYFGITDNKTMVVNLIPWRTYGNYGTYDSENRFVHLACHHNSTNENDIYPIREFYYGSVLVHEFGHSFINPLTNKYPFLFENYNIFKASMEKLQKSGYGSVKSIINDNIVRAITLRYLLLVRKNTEIYQQTLISEKRYGFELIENIISSLEDYENNRNIYNTIEEYYPIIISNLIDEHQKNINKK